MRIACFKKNKTESIGYVTSYIIFECFLSIATRTLILLIGCPSLNKYDISVSRKLGLQCCTSALVFLLVATTYQLR
ncbi:uncharacterized protein BKA55DRAFT_550541 [Fusarium redolens]|uniref:Uncharacterized protein n=1 Tax=Fusarium redolens TaxID=48865 RepID=A0A9P9KWI9_FUSRE|nr:uncharacterized protein BKA55DRAFT_550541 [Fusarium redolens]KAH7270075.1 hypothetical protein BKA55DRAFT_550541 [Fusarium redolens]